MIKLLLLTFIISQTRGIYHPSYPDVSWEQAKRAGMKLLEQYNNNENGIAIKSQNDYLCLAENLKLKPKKLTKYDIKIYEV